MGPLAAAARITGLKTKCFFFESDEDGLDILAKLPGDSQILGGACSDYALLASQLLHMRSKHIVLSYVSQKGVDEPIILGIMHAMDILRKSSKAKCGALVVTPVLSKEHMMNLVNVMAVLPFEIRSEDFSPIQGTSWAWIIGDLAWPRGSDSVTGFNEILRIIPPKHYTLKTDGSDCVLHGWRLDFMHGTKMMQDLQHSYTARLNGDSLGSGQAAIHLHKDSSRRLFVAEEEALLGLEKDLSNHISKIPGQSLAQRQLRRHLMLSSMPSVRVLAFLLSSMLAKAFEGDQARADFPLEFYSEAGNPNKYIKV